MGKVMCLICGTIIESKSQHDYNTCNCDNKAMVDGGDAYFRYGAKNISMILIYDDKMKRWRGVNEASDKVKREDTGKDNTKQKWWETLERAINDEERTKGKLKKGEQFFLHDKK